MSAFRFAREAPGRFTRARAACLGSSMAVLTRCGLCRGRVASVAMALRDATPGDRTSIGIGREPSRTEKNGSGRLGKSVRRRRFFL